MGTVEFNNLLLNHSDFLRPFAINLTRDSEAANDLFQDTLFKALSNKDKYNAGTNIRAWLYTIMRNIFINNYRRNAKQRLVFDQSTDGDYLINSKSAVIYNDAITNMQLKEINGAIRSLPEIFKTPFLLYVDGYKYNEIAQELGEPLGTIKSRIHFARKTLKEQLDRNKN
jgi:RNA polymerase sigma-70 factor (ECF subfamily)